MRERPWGTGVCHASRLCLSPASSLATASSFYNLLTFCRRATLFPSLTASYHATTEWKKYRFLKLAINNHPATIWLSREPSSINKNIKCNKLTLKHRCLNFYEWFTASKHHLSKIAFKHLNYAWSTSKCTPDISLWCCTKHRKIQKLV